MISETELDELRQLQSEVGQWAEQNFGVSPLHGGDGSPPEHTLIGIGEEIGELTTSVLKRAQGIDDSDKYADRDDVGVEAERDAVGDIIIYMLDTLHRSNTGILLADGVSQSEEQFHRCKDEIDVVRAIYSVYGDLAVEQYDRDLDTVPDGHVEACLPQIEKTFGDLMNALIAFCQLRTYDVMSCVRDAWTEVSGRTWDATITE